MYDRSDTPFAGKARTLEFVKKQDASFLIPDFLYFSASTWPRDRREILSSLAKRFAKTPVAVRSSANLEDSLDSSFAGAFTSILGVQPLNPAAMTEAIETVVRSMPGDSGDEVLVQSMVLDVDSSGVILTFDPDNGAPYYVMNYDDVSGRTDTITSGANAHKTIYLHRGIADYQLTSPRVRMMLRLARELEGIFGGQALDIEFALDRSGRQHLLQVRPISTARQWRARTTFVDQAIVATESFVSRLSRPLAGIHGSRTLLGNMTDWNPAEMIGAIPSPLAASIYRRLITEATWREARESMGYRRLPPIELMVLIVGRPFIDVRASLNSFLPAELEPDVAGRLVDACLERLSENPQLHDKVEFEVAFTAMDFEFDRSIADRYREFLSDTDIKKIRRSLATLTRAIIDPKFSGAPAKLLDKLPGDYETRYESGSAPDISHVYGLLNDVRTQGTLPFAILARHAFVAEVLLRTAVKRNAVAPERLDRLRRATKTVASEFATDVNSLRSGEFARSIFLSKYGHLRPGTYDITSMPYGKRPGLLDVLSSTTLFQGLDEEPLNLSRKESDDLARLMSEAGIDSISPESLIDYAQTAIRGREHAKFVFTKGLSIALEIVAEWGQENGLDRETLAWLDIEDIERHARECDGTDPVSRLREVSEQKADQGRAAGDVRLSYLIRSPGDIRIAPIHRSAANYITASKVEASPAFVHSSTDPASIQKSAIICIEHADPGFDWVFALAPAGLVTKFGGTNSHMAIRCLEFSIPAAIGCGEVMFETLRNARLVELNCREKAIRIVH